MTTFDFQNIFEQLDIDKIPKKVCDLVLTGSWQYGTNTDDSDFDLVLIHDGNIEGDLLTVDNRTKSNNEYEQRSGIFHLEIPDYEIEREYDIRFISYTNFMRKLFSADINCVEYICSPFYQEFTKSLDPIKGGSTFICRARDVFIWKSLPNPYFRYKLLRSLMGFVNPMNKKKSKKFIIPEKVNQNNLIKIANLYHLIKHRYYPFNPQKGIDMMVDEDGNKLDLIDPTSEYYNSTEIMVSVLERHNKELEEKYPDDIKYQQFEGGLEYSNILRDVYR